MITAGLENPTPDVSRVIAEAEAIGKGRHSHSFYTFLKMIRTFHFISSPITHITFNFSHLLTDADKQPADSLMKLAALDIDKLLVKMPGISKGVLFNVQTGSFRRMGTGFFGCPSRRHHARTANRGNLQFFSISHYPCSPFFILIPTCTIILITVNSISLPLLSGFKSIRTCCPSGGKSSPT